MEKQTKPYFPIFIDISEQPVVVVGAGTIAKRRIRTLLEFTSRLTVIAPEVNPELLSLSETGQLTLKKKSYEDADLDGAYMVIAATNDHKTNHSIYEYCKSRQILVNVCSDKNKCDFFFPGIAKKDQIVAGVTASGSDHKAARKTVEKIRDLLNQ